VSTVSTEPAGVVASDAELPSGTPVGEYTVELVLGRGGFGTVYRAVHPVIGKQVAIKVLARKYASDPDVISRFAAEARAVNQIRHRNIIDIFQFSMLPDGRHYYVMECLDGEPLDQYLKSHGPLALAEALPILRAIGRALDAAHAKGIAHRDLKPENIFLAVDADGERFPKLLDFGIAKLFGADTEDVRHRTATGMPIGTPYYMSPEQCRGKDVDQRTDVYSFGIVAYRMLTNTYPFDGADYVELLFQQVNAEPPPPSSRNSALPTTVDAAIAWMMRKDRDQRPATLGDALAAFDGIESHPPSPTTPRLATTPNAFAQTAVSTQAPPVARKPPKKPAVWIGATLVLVCSAAGVMLVMNHGGGRDEQPVASAPPKSARAMPPTEIAAPSADVGTPEHGSVAPPVRQVTITIKAPPANAKITFGPTDETLDHGAFVVDESSTATPLVITAKGFTRRFQITPDRDQTIDLTPKPVAGHPVQPTDSHSIESPNFHRSP
jgi:serine/threonine protein kinase